MSDEKILIERDIDYYHAIERFAGNVELYHKYLFRFINEDAYKRLQEDMQAENYEAAERSAHSLKGISGNLGINRIYDLSVALLSAIRGRNDADAKEINSRLIVEFDATATAIQTFAGA